MKCIQHSEHDAVAVCLACGRALCPQCVAFSGDAAACAGRCESTVDLLTSQRRNALAGYKLFVDGKFQDETLAMLQMRLKHSKFWLGILLIPIAYLLYRVVVSEGDDQALYIWLGAIALFFLVFSIQSIARWRKLIAKREELVRAWKSE